jgi:hypothetical protein
VKVFWPGLFCAATVIAVLAEYPGYGFETDTGAPVTGSVAVKVAGKFTPFAFADSSEPPVGRPRGLNALEKPSMNRARNEIFGDVVPPVDVRVTALPTHCRNGEAVPTPLTTEKPPRPRIGKPICWFGCGNEIACVDVIVTVATIWFGRNEVAIPTLFASPRILVMRITRVPTVPGASIGIPVHARYCRFVPGWLTNRP